MRTEYGQALSQFGSLVDPKTGIIRSVELVRISETDPQVFLAHAEPCDTTPLTGIKAANRGAACATTPERAVLRACGESVERYCSSFFDTKNLRIATEQELRHDEQQVVSARDIYPFADWQYGQHGFPYGKVVERSSVRWVEGTSLLTHQMVWVPASCVYVPYVFDVSVEPFTHMPISTGLAAGPSVDSCIRKGIFEILERDALMLVWYSRMAAPRIDPESCRGVSPLIDPLISVARNGGPAWYINLLTLDVDIPIISAALIDPGTPPLTSFGIAADEDPIRALLLALEEAVLTRLLVNRTEEVTSKPNYVHTHPQTLRDHLLAHASSSELREKARFLTDSGKVMGFPELLEKERNRHGRTVTEQLAKAGFEIIFVDVSTADIVECGFRVVRAIIPKMQPLDNDHRYRHLGGSRLFTVPQHFGLPIHTLADLNDCPHPFP